MPKKSSLTFKEPPEKYHRNRYDWDQIADELRERPGEWAMIFEHGPTSLVSSIRLGVRALPLDQFEVRTTDNTKDSPRTCTLWLRYNPKKKGKKK